MSKLFGNNQRFYNRGSKRHSSNTCMATVWISAFARRNIINARNELNINFVLRRKCNRKN